MLQQKFRLPHSVSFSQSMVVHSPLFVVKSLPNSLPYSRFGFIISKKAAKLAVVRNQTKRKVRSCIEEEWLTKVKGKDILFILKTQAITATRQQIAEEVEKVMGKIIDKNQRIKS